MVISSIYDQCTALACIMNALTRNIRSIYYHSYELVVK